MERSENERLFLDTPESDRTNFKFCRKCDQAKHALLFGKSAANKDGRQSWCLVCSRTNSRLYASRKPKKNVDNLLRQYWPHLRITHARRQFNRLLKAQGNACAMCLLPFDGTRKSFIDHCHTTGIVRGILCPQCNSGLGMFKDNTDNLQRAMKYLNKKRYIRKAKQGSPIMGPD